MDCGWNLFHREGASEDPATLSVNFDYLDHLHTAGLNTVIVFWANSESFDAVWAEAVPYAHSLGLKVLRAVFGFCGGPLEAPGAPDHLLRESGKGPGTALCPHDPEAREWSLGMIERLLGPDMDGLDIETARHTFRRCICPQCSAMNPYEWDVFVVNFLSEHILRIKPDAEVFMHVYTDALLGGGKALAEAYGRLNGAIRHIFGWEADDETKMREWFALDPRFEPFAKLGRVLLFPGGASPDTPASDRVARIFRWCRMAADMGKTGYLFDYRMFGGTEWANRPATGLPAVPLTRLAKRLPRLHRRHGRRPARSLGWTTQANASCWTASGGKGTGISIPLPVSGLAAARISLKSRLTARLYSLPSIRYSDGVALGVTVAVRSRRFVRGLRGLCETSCPASVFSACSRSSPHARSAPGTRRPCWPRASRPANCLRSPTAFPPNRSSWNPSTTSVSTGARGSGWPSILATASC